MKFYVQEYTQLAHVHYFIFIDILTSPLPNDTIDIKAISNARQLYSSCVNELAIESDGVDTVLSIIDNDFGGWPILNGLSWNETQFNLSHLLFKLRLYNNNIIFNCGTTTDDKNSSAYYVRVRNNISLLPIFFSYA